MDVIAYTFFAPPFLVGGALIFIIAVLTLLLPRINGGRVLPEEWGAFFVFAAFALIVWAVIGFAWTGSRNDNLLEQGTAEFQYRYQMTIVNGDLPIGTGQESRSVTAFLHSEAGPQSCLITVTPEATYDVSCNGTEVLPQEGIR